MAKTKARKPGDLVWLASHSGFVGDSWKWRVRVLPEYDGYDPLPCMLCDDEECVEHYEVEVADGPYAGMRLPHVSDCQMFDEQQKP